MSDLIKNKLTQAVFVGQSLTAFNQTLTERLSQILKVP